MPDYSQFLIGLDAIKSDLGPALLHLPEVMTHVLLGSRDPSRYGMTSTQEMLDQIFAIRAERNTETRLMMLQKFNDSLPENIRLQMPSLITNAYVRRAFDMIEERILLLA